MHANKTRNKSPNKKIIPNMTSFVHVLNKLPNQLFLMIHESQLLQKLSFLCDLEQNLSQPGLPFLRVQEVNLHLSTHTVNFGSEMVQAKHVSGKNIFCSMNAYKSRGKRIFEIVHWPFELPPN